MYNALQTIQAFEAGQGQRKERERERTMQGVSNALAGGNYAGGAGLMFNMGDIQGGMQLQQYGKSLEDAEAEKKRIGLIKTGMGLLQTPLQNREAMRPQLATTLQQFGVQLDEQQLAAMDLSDEGIKATLAVLQDPDSIMQQMQSMMAPTEYSFQNVEGVGLVKTDPRAGSAEVAMAASPGYERTTLADGVYEYIPGRPESLRKIGDAPAKAPLVQNIMGDGSPGSRPIIGDPPKDYQAVWDEANQTYRFEPIPGSDAAREREGAAIKANTSLKLADQQMELMNSSIDKAISQADFWSAGLMAQATAGIGATPARNLRATLDTIMANIGFEKLQEMRETSPTGGALGNVTERELAFLQSVRGSLDQIQDPAQLREVLAQVKQSLQIIHEIRKMNMQGNITNSGERIPTGNVDQATDLPPGFEVVQ